MVARLHSGTALGNEQGETIHSRHTGLLGHFGNEKPGPKLHALGSHLRDTLDKVKPQTEDVSVVARVRGNGGKSDYEGAA